MIRLLEKIQVFEKLEAQHNIAALNTIVKCSHLNNPVFQKIEMHERTMKSDNNVKIFSIT